MLGRRTEPQGDCRTVSNPAASARSPVQQGKDYCRIEPVHSRPLAHRHTVSIEPRLGLFRSPQQLGSHCAKSAIVVDYCQCY